MNMLLCVHDLPVVPRARWWNRTTRAEATVLQTAPIATRVILAWGGRRVSNPLVTRFTVWPLDLFGFVLSVQSKDRTSDTWPVEPLLYR